MTTGPPARVYDLAGYQRAGKAELERLRKAEVEAACELAALQREHPALYAALQVRKVDVVTLGRQAALRRLEELTSQYLAEHRPKPARAAPGQRPVPAEPRLTRAQAYVKVLATPEGKRLFELTRT